MKEVIEENNELEVFSQLETKISKYIKLADDFVDDDLIDLFTNSFKVFKFMRSSYTFISQKKIAYFLKGLNLDNEPTVSQLNKLNNYINSEKKAEFISECVGKVIASKSKKASFLLGLLVHRLINSNANITYKELICANALEQLFDFDIDNIKILSMYAQYFNENTRLNSKWFYFNYKFKNWCKREGIDTNESFFLTIEKCTSSQLLIKDIELDLDFDEDDISLSSGDNTEAFKLTQAGLYLIDNLKYLDAL